MQPDIESEKRLAAARSLEFIADGMVVGLGSGSTAAYMIAMLADRVRTGLRITGVPTSATTRALAARAGVPLMKYDGAAAIDVTIDGADEVDPHGRLIKGGGGALLHEKIIASASRSMVVIVDSAKEVPTLGKFPLPLEVIPLGWRRVQARVRELGGAASLRVDPRGEAIRTDGGNYLLDGVFGPIHNPESLARELDATVGIVEHGLFLGLADRIIVGRGATTRLIEYPRK